MNIAQQVGNRKFNNECFGRNQWLTASVAKQSLACYLFSGVGVWSKSGFKGLFSKLKGINIHMQHYGPEKVDHIGNAVNTVWLLPRSKQLETRNWELWGKNDLRLRFYFFYYWYICYPFFSPISWYPIGSYSLVPSRAVRPPKRDPAKPHCFLTMLA